MEDLRNNPSDGQPSDGRTRKGGAGKFHEPLTKDFANQLNGDFARPSYANNTNMTDYAKMKTAELEALLKQRSLSCAGKKADMVARLQEADKAEADKAAPSLTWASTAASENCKQVNGGVRSVPSSIFHRRKVRAAQDDVILPANLDNESAKQGPVMITPQRMTTLLEASEEDILLLDVRVSTKYALSRIRGALNLCIPITLLKKPAFNVQKLVQTFTNEGQRKKFENWEKHKYIIVYDIDSSRLMDAPGCARTLKKFSNEGWNGPSYIIRGGFKEFSSQFPSFVSRGTGSTSNSAERARSSTPPPPLPLPPKDELQEQNSPMGSIDVDPPPPVEFDVRSQSLSGSTLVSAWKSEDGPYSAASVTDVAPYEAAREEFISLIRKEKRLGDAIKGAEELLRPETFEESFRNMFVTFATHLRAEASHPEEKDAARAATINHIYIANCVTEGVFNITEFEPMPRKRDVLESFLRRYKEKNGDDDSVEVFKGDKVDDLDAYEGNELEGPINLLKMEKFIQSSRAWSRMFDNLENWMRAVRKAKQPDQKMGDVSFNIEAPSLRDTQNRENQTRSTLPFESKRFANVKNPVARLQVALFWAWVVKTLAQLYAQPNSVMQALFGCIAIILPMYATILLPQEPVFRGYILCLLVPRAYMVHANALGLGILASFSYLSIPLVRTEKFHMWSWGDLMRKEETPYARVKWQCTCGDEFHEDFAEPRERDAIALFEHLYRTGNRPQLEISSTDDISTTRVIDEGLPGIAVKTTPHANSSNNNNQQQSSATDASNLVTETYSESPVSTSAHNGSAQNNTSGQPCSVAGAAQSLSTAHSGERRDEWFLLCHDHYENAGKALNIRVPDLLDGVSLMRHLRRRYIASRGGFWRHFKWSKIRNFDFVRFQAHLDPLAQEELVFKDKEWGVPPDCCDSNWSPWPLKERPPRGVERMLRHYWHYPHDSMSFRFTNACKHLSQNIWQSCESGFTDVLNFLSYRPAPSSIWTTMRRASSRFYMSVKSWFKKTWTNHKTNTLPQSNRDVNLGSRAPQGNNRQQQHSATSPTTPPVHSHQGTDPSAVTQPTLQQQRLPHSISSVYPRRLRTELHPDPTCYGWGLYLDESFAVPTPLIALLLILLFAVLISTLTVALVDFHRGDRYDAFSLPSWAVSAASLVAFMLFWCCDRWI